MRPAFLFVVMALTACESDADNTPGEIVTRGARRSASAEPAPGFEAAKFCPEKKSFSLANALWLARLSRLEYKHYSVAGPAFEELGFGRPGDGKRYKKYWYIHRIKLIDEDKKTLDDSWFGESARLERLQLVKDEFKDEFGLDYVPDGQKADDYENSFIQKMDGNRIQMISAVANSKLIPGSTTQFIYAENLAQDYSVIAFRGTEPEQFADILTDINIATTPLEGMGKVHAGFYNALQDVLPQLLEFLTRKTATVPMNLWLTGHSLGGALATLLTAKIMLLKEKGGLPNLNLLGVYSFGAPRLGDPDFASRFDELAQERGVTAVRFRNHTDPVTQIPGGETKIGDYLHAGSLAYFDADGILYHKGGWLEIETKSDLRTAGSSEALDHKMVEYEELIQKAYIANLETELVSCKMISGNVPPIPFYEDKSMRSVTGY